VEGVEEVEGSEETKEKTDLRDRPPDFVNEHPTLNAQHPSLNPEYSLSRVSTHSLRCGGAAAAG
jgi:hypothetical protein